MSRTLAGRALALAVAVTTGALTLAAQAHALTEKPVWKCRASAGYTTVNGGDRAEAVVANGNVNTARGQDPDHALCASGESGAGNLPAPLGIPDDVLTASSESAVTKVEPQLGPSSAQRVSARGRVENLALRFPGVDTVLLGATVAEASATGMCGDGAPQLAGTSRVTGLTLNGRAVDTNALATRLTELLNTLNPLVDVKQNETIRAFDALTIRALHIVVRLGTGAVIDAVVAEAKTGFDGPVCDPPPPSPDLCPEGSEYFAEQNMCSIVLSDGLNIDVGSPRDSPRGASVMSLDSARRRFGNSPCLTGPGRRFAIVGTNRSNQIQGTRFADRIIARGGSDRVAATRDHDCVDGGRGNDTLSGDLGNDRIYGGSGSDRLIGASGNDRIHGGPGHDTINGGYGADRIWGGRGNDAINIATAGRRASADCGRGSDTVRYNRVERKRVRRCEHRKPVRD